ncbi:MAG: methyltransferase domain-containing protein [Myxococcota bacterium]
MSAQLPYGPRRRHVPLPSGAITLWTPMGTDALLDTLAEAPPDPDDKMPYWADLWPSSVALAAEIDAGRIPVKNRHVLEIGAGLGLVSLCAARAGGQCIATDWDEDALLYIQASAEASGLRLTTARLDWRAPSIERPADIVFAADVMYEARNVSDVARALPQLIGKDGEVWLSDPGRAHLPEFVRTVAADFETAYANRIVDNKINVHLIRLRRK